MDPTDPLSLTAYGYANSNPITYSDPTGLMNANPGPDGVNGQKRANNPVNGTPPALNAPKVQDEKLQKIINASYLRDGSSSQIPGNGSTQDALRYELENGVPVGREGGEKWHFKKTAQQWAVLAKWLESANEEGSTASESDKKIAHTVAKDHYDALNSEGKKGAVTAEINKLKEAGDVRYDDFKIAMNSAENKVTVVDITGATVSKGNPDWRQKDKIVAAGSKLEKGILLLSVFSFAITASQYGLEEAALQSVDVTGVGQQFINMPCSPFGPVDGPGCVV